MSSCYLKWLWFDHILSTGCPKKCSFRRRENLCQRNIFLGHLVVLGPNFQWSPTSTSYKHSLSCVHLVSRGIWGLRPTRRFFYHRKALIIANNTPGQKTLQNEPSLGGEAMLGQSKGWWSEFYVHVCIVYRNLYSRWHKFSFKNKRKSNVDKLKWFSAFSDL